MSSPSITFQNLLRLALPAPFRWLSSGISRQTSIHWAVTTLSEAQPGDIALLAVADWDAAALQQARQSQVSGIILLGDESIPKQLIAAEIPMVSLANPSGDVRQLQRLILTTLINHRVVLMERSARIHAQLSQLAADGKGLDGVVKAMADISGRGVLLQDKRGQALASAPSPGLAGIWVEVIEQLKSLDSLPAPFTDRKQVGTQAVILTQDIQGKLARLVTPVNVGDVARGYLSIIGMERELDALDFAVAEQGRLVCAMEMARNKAIRETEKRLKGDLIQALLQDALSPRDAVLWVQAMGLDLAQAHLALRFAWDSPTSPSRRRLETIVNGEIARLHCRTVVHPMGTEVVCFCQVSPSSSRPEEAIELGRSVLAQTDREYPEVPVRCGIGAPAFSLEEWRNSFRQAGQALEMARRLNERHPLYYADLSIYRLLFQIEHSPELVAFQEEILGPLLALEGNGELIHTLEAFFEHNGNLSQTAEALFIHRNTLIYRLERIAAITHLDLDKPESRLAAQLALHIHRMTRPRSGC